ncbi:MAG: ATP synthase F1 subunit gamma [Eudoraea sp.]|nr:ATP synthase F1 subunit gamma [Eudoraea sp.]
MPSLKEVKTRINSVISTQQITSAMKMVAAAKLRRAQDGIMQMRPYADKLNEILVNVSGGLDNDEGDSFTTTRDIDSVLIVVITSDRGLCGAFNNNICKRTITLIDEDYRRQFDNGNVTILTIGKRGREFFQKRGYNVIDDFTETFIGLSFEKGKKAAERAMNGFLKGEFDKIDIVYNEFKNVATQIIRAESFLPVHPGDTSSGTHSIDYIFQPNEKVIVQEMIPKTLKVQFYKSILESNASEHGARMTAMEQATENAGELLRELKLTYNRTRQAAITKEILEIVGGAEALG